jgi:phosphoribosylamine--glycine ligase
MPKVLLPCPDQRASRIEWDKFYLRDIIEQIDAKYNPINFMAKTTEQTSLAIRFFEEEGLEIAIKPRNLTGGKGVKVMGKHFDTYKDGEDYAKQVLSSSNQEGVEIQEKLVGHEFTLQIFTDGNMLIRPPVTHDYPYREDGDLGPGTGGMGDFSMRDGLMPFLSEVDYNEALSITEKILAELQERGIDYKGVIYPSFFKTENGLKMVEVNARGGDPELINIIDLIEEDIDMVEVLRQIALGELEQGSIRYKKLASTMIYLVSPDYAYRKGPTYNFSIDDSALVADETRIRFAAAEGVSMHSYRTVGSSRSVGISANGSTPWEARQKIINTIEEAFDCPLSLDYRSEVGDSDYISRLV